MQIDFIKYRGLAFGLSMISVVLTCLSFSFTGCNFGIDFTGGVVMEAKSDSSIDVSEVRSLLKLHCSDKIFVQSLDGVNGILIKSKSDSMDSIKSVLDEYSFEYTKVDYIGPQITSNALVKSAFALIFALIGVFIYLCIRFNVFFAISGLLALMHDVVVTLGFISVSGMEISLVVVIGLLTIIGYSINDSVVIFDRIRENLGRDFKNFCSLINSSINSTLSRTILTSVTTLFAAFPLIIFDKGYVHEFSIVIFFGVLLGTYSSIFLASLFLTVKYK